MGEPISPSADDLEGLPEGGLAGLIAKGRAQGSLTTGDVFDALADEVEPSPGQLDAIYNHIRASGIELVDEIAADLAAEDGADEDPGQAPAAAAATETPAISIPIPLIVPVPSTEVARPRPRRPRSRCCGTSGSQPARRPAGALSGRERASRPGR